MNKPKKKVEFIPIKPSGECMHIAEERYKAGYAAGYNQACNDWEVYHEWDIKTNYVKKGELPSVEEIENIIAPAGISFKEKAQAIAKRIGKGAR